MVTLSTERKQSLVAEILLWGLLCLVLDYSSVKQCV